MTRLKQVDPFQQLCIDNLRSSGCRITKARLAVIRCLSEASRPQTPREIIDTIESDNSIPDIDKVSVYRVLETLHEKGLVHRVFPEGGYMACEHQECQRTLHILARCIDCGSAEERDIPGEVINPIKAYLEKQLSFAPSEHFFQVDGTCSKCSLRERRKGGAV
jgi:Fur family transcriptional regulator, ferric uptake regulator